jgi:hypothetical protein
VSYEGLRRYVHEAKVDLGGAEGLTSDERAKLGRLRRENRTLRMKREIPKKAAVFFATEAGGTGERVPVRRAREDHLPGPSHVPERLLALGEAAAVDPSPRRSGADQHDPRDPPRQPGTYGMPRVHAELRFGSTRCSRKRVARLMRTAGLEGVHRRRFARTTVSDRDAAAARIWSTQLPGQPARS